MNKSEYESIHIYKIISSIIHTYENQHKTKAHADTHDAKNLQTEQISVAYGLGKFQSGEKISEIISDDDNKP